jgi:hypothetical protein
MLTRDGVGLGTLRGVVRARAPSTATGRPIVREEVTRMIEGHPRAVEKGPGGAVRGGDSDGHRAAWPGVEADVGQGHAFSRRGGVGLQFDAEDTLRVAEMFLHTAGSTSSDRVNVSPSPCDRCDRAKARGGASRREFAHAGAPLATWTGRPPPQIAWPIFTTRGRESVCDLSARREVEVRRRLPYTAQVGQGRSQRGRRGACGPPGGEHSGAVGGAWASLA